MRFLVEAPGLLTTVQDGGRYGYERFGMSPAGPMDRRAFRIANILVGNRRDESALEATVTGPTLVFDGDGVIALTGADMDAELNGAPCPTYRALAVHAGDRLSMGAAKEGCRAYIAFFGGLDVPPIMGSRATALQNRIGGYEGRKLAAGDAISVRAEGPLPGNLAGRQAPRPVFSRDITVRVILGPQDDLFTREGLDTFLTRPYTVSNDFSRMGYRLEGPVIHHVADGNIISDGIVAGTIQVPTSGQPIIMMAERQTVGGYTKIATVISADLPLIGQAKAGDRLHFRSVAVEEAHRALRQEEQALRQLEESVSSAPAEMPEKQYRIHLNGQVYHVKIQRIEQEETPCIRSI